MTVLLATDGPPTRLSPLSDVTCTPSSALPDTVEPHRLGPALEPEIRTPSVEEPCTTRSLRTGADLCTQMLPWPLAPPYSTSAPVIDVETAYWSSVIPSQSPGAGAGESEVKVTPP